MKKLMSFVLVATAFGSLKAQQAIGDDEILEEFLVARSMESPVRYARVARELADSAAGTNAYSKANAYHRFVLAAVMAEHDFPRGFTLGENVRRDYLFKGKVALELLIDKKESALADKDKGLAYYLLSLNAGNSGDRDKLLSKAIQFDNVYALNEKGVQQMLGGKSGELKMGFYNFDRAAQKHNPAALYNLGMCYFKGLGCDKDLDKAFENFKRAAEIGSGHPKAMNALGEMYRDGNGVEKNIETARDWFSKSAERGNSLGQYNYAMELLKDDPESREAVELLRRAAHQRHLLAMVEYARCLYGGLVATDEKTGRAEHDREAVSWWYHCATELKYPPAMHELAQCFMDGRGVDKDERMAVVLYFEAVYQGNVPSMLSLADCYEKGVGPLKKSHYNANWWKTKVHACKGVRNARVWLKRNKLKCEFWDEWKKTKGE